MIVVDVWCAGVGFFLVVAGFVWGRRVDSGVGFVLANWARWCGVICVGIGVFASL